MLGQSTRQELFVLKFCTHFCSNAICTECQMKSLYAACLQELSALWEALLAEMSAGNAPGLARTALTFAYFWYNFMPLARGTAAAGYVAILGIFLAAGMPITSPIPKVRLDSCASQSGALLN